MSLHWIFGGHQMVKIHPKGKIKAAFIVQSTKKIKLD